MGEFISEGIERSKKGKVQGTWKGPSFTSFQQRRDRGRGRDKRTKLIFSVIVFILHNDIFSPVALSSLFS